MLNKMTNGTKTRSKKEDVCVPYDVLVEQIAERIDYFEYEVKDVIEGLIAVLGKILAEQNKPVDVWGLGRFSRSNLKARELTSNMTGNTVELPDRVGCSFKPTRGFKKKLNEDVNNLNRTEKE